MNAPFAELVAATNFSFLRGASHPSDMALTALLLGQSGIGIADRNSVAGVVRAYAVLKDLREKLSDPAAGDDATLLAQLDAERAQSFKLVVGARLVFADETPDIVVHPQNRNGWARLTRLLTTGNLRAKKGECRLYFDDLAQAAHDLLLIVMPSRNLARLPSMLARLNDLAQGDVWLGATMPRRGDDRRRLAK
ncbi:MAG: PHP domain-containing protein, partial [Methylocystis silviterrae]|uniref:PHP domain-containing protein n=1 Tax=Methylocystis silviterrae TaxID=2743612 RepID=UPI003C709563